MIKFKNYYKRPKTEHSDFNNYFTERYNHNLTLQAKIEHIQTVYSDKDTRQQNPLVQVELADVRTESDGEFVRSYLQDYPEPAKRSLYFNGDIKEGDYVQFRAMVTVLEKTASAEYNSSDFVKNHLPKVMPFIRGNAALEKIELEEVKPVIEGVLSQYETKQG